MNLRHCSVLALCLGAALSLAALPAAAGEEDKNWKCGCADAKAGTYDRAHCRGRSSLHVASHRTN